MEPLGDGDIKFAGNAFSCGNRKCPNPSCYGHLFVVYDQNRVVTSYPPVRLDFDSDSIPGKIRTTFEQAITCHASGCFIAAGIMVRRTLEEVCADRKASGKDLKARIGDLRSKIVLPTELLEAMDELRLLGNDAAHVEAKAYDSVSEIEVTTAIEFTKEILKSLYQYRSLLGKLRALKKKTTP